MPKLIWDVAGTRFYEAGVDRGVLYVGASPGVSWSGLVSVEENSNGGDAKPYYIDGVKYLNISSAEEFQATITAYTYPDLFAQCDGTAVVRPGLFASQQRRKEFGFSYRTKVGNDINGPDHAYRIHLVYNALAAPSQRTNQSLSDSPETSNFSWLLTTRPPALAGLKRSAHLVIDSRYIHPITLGALEDIIYGTDMEYARLPDYAELLTIFDTPVELVVTDNDDGTYTITGPDSAVTDITSGLYDITGPTVVPVDADSYSISS